MDATEILKNARTILVIDWPSKDVPESLALAGLRVVVRSGPGPRDYSAYLRDESGSIAVSQTGLAPEQADIVYAFRPLEELPGIIGTAKRLQAKAIWTQSGLSAAGAKDPCGCWLAEEQLLTARRLVEAAGLRFLCQPYIADVARTIAPAS